MAEAPIRVMEMFWIGEADVRRTPPRGNLSGEISGLGDDGDRSLCSPSLGVCYLVHRNVPLTGRRKRLSIPAAPALPQPQSRQPCHQVHLRGPDVAYPNWQEARPT